jgi:hypothetical protein
MIGRRGWNKQFFSLRLWNAYSIMRAAKSTVRANGCDEAR